MRTGEAPCKIRTWAQWMTTAERNRRSSSFNILEQNYSSLPNEKATLLGEQQKEQQGKRAQKKKSHSRRACGTAGTGLKQPPRAKVQEICLFRFQKKKDFPDAAGCNAGIRMHASFIFLTHVEFCKIRQDRPRERSVKGWLGGRGPWFKAVTTFGLVPWCFFA